MPRYQFRCNDCRRSSQLYFSYREYEDATPRCAHCGSANVKRRIGRVALAKTDDARMDALADESLLANIDENDPQSIGRFMRQMGQEMGEDLGDEFGEVVERLEKGQSPDEIEAAMPDLGSDDPD